MAFRGYFDNTLDAKNRLTIPAKLRNLLAEGVVVALQREGNCIAIWSPAEFESHVSRILGRVDPLSTNYDNLERFFNAYSAEIELDAAGRVMLPAKLLEEAGLAREVAVIGAGNRLEVWDRAAWRAHQPELKGTVKEIGRSSPDGHTA